ncbi:NERD domain-containing protein [Rhizobium laguerreae]|nr:NERD domain-containing protein [Rhizobium laguerreae]
MLKTIGLLIVVLVVVGFIAGRRKRPTAATVKGQDGERRVAKVIASLGYPALHDVYLPSDNGTTQIDHIVRAGNCIVVIETKNFGGVLYGDVHDQNWRQSFRRRDSRSFFNPLKQNAVHVKAVKKIAGPEADVRQLVVMAGTSRFPNGTPEGVLNLADLKQWLRLTFVDAGKYGRVIEPWELLGLAAKKGNNRTTRAHHADTLRRATAPRPEGARIDPTF